MYDNQSEIDEIEKKIQKVSMDLRISGLMLDRNVVIGVMVLIPLRGNRTTIQELKKMGWVCGRKERTRDTDRGYASTRHPGYGFMQRMSFEIKK